MTRRKIEKGLESSEKKITVFCYRLSRVGRGTWQQSEKAGFSRNNKKQNAKEKLDLSALV